MDKDYEGLKEKDFEELEKGWVLLNETQAMDLTGAGGPYPLETRYGKFQSVEGSFDRPVGFEITEKGVVALFDGRAPGTVGEFVWARIILPAPQKVSLEEAIEQVVAAPHNRNFVKDARGGNRTAFSYLLTQVYGKSNERIDDLDSARTKLRDYLHHSAVVV